MRENSFFFVLFFVASVSLEKKKNENQIIF